MADEATKTITEEGKTLSDDNALQPAPTAAELSRAELVRLVKNVQANPASVEFPQDIWGFTNELKKVGLKTASAVRGQDDKNEVLVGVLTVLLAHTKARLEIDKAARAADLARIEYASQDRRYRERVTGAPLPGPTEYTVAVGI